MAPLNFDIHKSRYKTMIGVGGLGTGMFFALNYNHTLGREESRSGHFLDRKDYCKLHIISHYVKTLLGPQFRTIPVGRLGEDDAGRRIFEEMAEAGLEMDYVQVCPGEQTLFSLCFSYPDGSGGNLTTDDSACDRVNPADVAGAQAVFTQFAGHGIVLSAPEVPLSAREKLLEMGTTYGFFRAASFISSEIEAAMKMGLLAKMDLLALNLDEARFAAGLPAEDQPADKTVEAVIHHLNKVNPNLSLSFTAGKHGSWSWDGKELHFQPAFQVPVTGTAGAGDAHLAAMIAGLAAGLSLAKAQELGSLVAAHSVTSPHTIDKRIDRDALRSFAGQVQAVLSPDIQQLLSFPEM
jgi:ribokinase